MRYLKNAVIGLAAFAFSIGFAVAMILSIGGVR